MKIPIGMPYREWNLHLRPADERIFERVARDAEQALRERTVAVRRDPDAD